ncbi:hypothetical protein D3C72_1925630 [compost metagenome]
MGLGARHPPVERRNDVRVGVRSDHVRQLVGREMFGHSHEQLIECEVAARVDDGARVVVHNQKLVGLHRLAVLFNEVGEHQASVVLVAVKFNGHGRPAVQ